MALGLSASGAAFYGLYVVIGVIFLHVVVGAVWEFRQLEHAERAQLEWRSIFKAFGKKLTKCCRCRKRKEKAEEEGRRKSKDKYNLREPQRKKKLAAAAATTVVTIPSATAAKATTTTTARSSIHDVHRSSLASTASTSSAATTVFKQSSAYHSIRILSLIIARGWIYNFTFLEYPTTR